MADQRKRKFRVLKDFTDAHGNERKVGDIVEMLFADAQGLVNSDKLTADLGDPEPAEPKEAKGHKRDKRD